MVKIIKYLSLALLLVIVGGGLYAYLWFQDQREPFTDDAVAAHLALQDDSAVELPAAVDERLSDGAPQPNPQRNLYFGELHLHTEQSFDSVLFGNRLTIEEAYRFARGEDLTNAGGEVMQLSVPMDFVAITDHAEGFGTRRHCDDEGLPWRQRLTCWVTTTPNTATFMYLRRSGNRNGGNVSRDMNPYCQTVGIEQCIADASADWADYVALADAHNEPGVFTTLAAYEYSPPLTDRGKYHRNVFFRGSDVPEFAYSFMDAPTAPDLWRSLEQDCQGDCDFLTIPHNMNRAWGLPYGAETRLGTPYDGEDWERRARYEPLAEIYQIKGASECAMGAFATDEECNFEQVFELCEAHQATGCAFPTGFTREGLKRGLLMEPELGVNPFQFGFIAATDSHNSNPGDAEEWDYRGKTALIGSPAIRRQRHSQPGQGPHHSVIGSFSPGGLAAVWATENTRDALFSAVQQRETYGTSGTRIQLRFFGGAAIDEALLEQTDLVAAADAKGVPMWSELTDSENPSFLVWALADPMSAPLQRIQMVKGWVENGEARESVMDIACSDGLQVDPATGRCPDNGASVDLADCSISSGSGAAELKTVWRDPDFDPAESAFYYVRVLQNPTCRWSTYDAIRLGREPTPHAPPTIRERAWSSPIWYRPEGG